MGTDDVQSVHFIRDDSGASHPRASSDSHAYSINNCDEDRSTNLDNDFYRQDFGPNARKNHLEENSISSQSENIFFGDG